MAASSLDSRRPNQDHHTMPTTEAAAEFALRILAFAAAAAAALLIGLTRQSSDFGGFQLHASYKSSPAFKYFLGGNAAVGAYCLLSLPSVFLAAKGLLVHVLDLLMISLAISAATAGTAVGYIAKKGNSAIGWPQVCDYFERFCNNVEIAFACSYLGFVLLLIACTLSFARRSRISSDTA